MADRSPAPGGCVLCEQPGGTILWKNPLLRVIDACDPVYPGITRVVLNEHIAEMTDLDDVQRGEVMRVVYIVEQVLRDTLRPDKINLAALGNMVPHLHWHVIPRWFGDPHFPQAIWATVGDATPEAVEDWRARHAALRDALPAFHQTLTKRLDHAYSGAARG